MNEILEKKKAKLDPNDPAVKIVLAVASYISDETVAFEDINEDQLNQIITVKEARDFVLRSKKGTK